MIAYQALAHELHQLEAKYGGNRNVPLPAGLKPVVPGSSYPHPNVQFFALDNATASSPPLPIVVLVGSNYSQVNGGIGAVTPSNTSARAVPWPYVEDDDPRTFKGIRTKLTNSRHTHAPCADLGSDFHLVFTNLVPWITTQLWTDPMIVPHQAALLNTHIGPSATPRAYVCELHARIGSHVAAWIGHGASVRSSLIELLGVGGLAVTPRFTSNNLASRCRPNFQLMP